MKWTHEKAFAYFNVTPRNNQWSWSGRNEETQTVVLTIWQDGWRREGNKFVYERRHDAGGTSKPGFKFFVDDMQWALEHCDGVFNVIMARAEDVHAVPRKIAECWPRDKNLRMKIREFDPAIGFLAAETVAQ